MARFLQILAVLAVGLTAALALDVTLEGTQTEVRVGDPLNITCHITDFERGTVVNWMKVSEQESIKFGENHILSPDYKTDDKRYSLFLEKLSSTEYNMLLVISEAKLEDAGTFSVIGIIRDKRPTAQFNLTVRVDPKPPVLTFDGAVIQGGEVFDMEQDSLHDISCEVTGASPAVVPVISAGDHIIGLNEEGYKLDAEPHVTEGEFVGFFEVKNDASLSATQVPFDARYANKDVRCEVHGNPALASPSFKTKFPGMSPVWSPKCSESHLTYVGAQDLTVGCTVTAIPAASVHVVWHYRNPAAHGDFHISPDMPADDWPTHYGMDVMQVDETTSHVNLLISAMKPQMFREYTFIAKNDMGTANFTLTLERDLAIEVSTDTGKNAARSVTVSSAFLLLTSAIYFFLLH